MAEQIFKKETGWGGKAIDFKGKHEIMVTITLHEYRGLVERDAKHTEELRKANNAKLEAEGVAAKLRDKLDKLLAAAGDEEEEEE